MGDKVALKRDILEPNRYQYLNVEDSRLYDKVKNSDSPKSKRIKRLLEGKAASSKGQHCASTY